MDVTDILADVTEILRTSDGHSGGPLTDILADVQWTFCGRPHKIPADAEYWNRMSNRCPLRPHNCLTRIPADVRSLFLIIFFLSPSGCRGHCVPILRMDIRQMSARNSSGK